MIIYEGATCICNVINFPYALTSISVQEKNSSVIHRLSYTNAVGPFVQSSISTNPGGRKYPRQFQLSRTSLLFKQYLPNVATFTKIYWRTRFWKNFASRVQHVAMAASFLTPCLLKF